MACHATIIHMDLSACMKSIVCSFEMLFFLFSRLIVFSRADLVKMKCLNISIVEWIIYY